MVRRRGGRSVVWPIVLIVVVLSMGVLSFTNPFFLHDLGRGGLILESGSTDPTATPQPAGDDPLTIAAEDAAYLSRIYAERSHEIGYCGFLESRQLSPHLADTVSATAESLEFSTENCPGSGQPPATIHTHPSGDPDLSRPDKVNFITKDYRYMCIQVGKISAAPGTRASALACYEKHHLGGDTHYSRVPVVVK